MNHKIRPFKVYITTFANISDENNEGSNDTTNEKKQWGKNGVTRQLMNIAAKELETPETNEHEQSNFRYYVEEPRSLIIADVNGKTK